MNKWLAPVCTITLVIIIAVMSASPALKTEFHTHGRLHPWFHIGVFTLVCFSAMFCSERSGTRLMLILVLMAFGWFTEYREHLVDGFPLEQIDVWHDAMGVALGGVLGWFAAGAQERSDAA